MDTSKCVNPRRPCPIWIRGINPEGKYIRGSFKEILRISVRDWTAATRRVHQWEESGDAPKPAPQHATIQALRDQFIANMNTTNRNHETIRKYRMLFKQMEVFAEDKGIRFLVEFDLAILESFRASWKDGDLSRQKKQERLRSIFRYALKHKMISGDPAAELDSIKVHRNQVIPFTDDEMTRIIVAAKARNPRVYALVLLMQNSGMRISDAAMLRKDQVNHGRLSFRARKVKKDVSMPLPAAVIKALNAFPSASPEHFFWSGKSKLHGLTNLYRNKYLAKVFKAAELPDAHSHQFRHSFASKLLTAGVSVENVAALLGNTPQIVLKHYSAWIPARQEALDKAVKMGMRTRRKRQSS